MTLRIESALLALLKGDTGTLVDAVDFTTALKPEFLGRMLHYLVVGMSVKTDIVDF
ncbi:MAG: hypothetical protein K2G59_00840 [Muribaculaceae bacterium]|nr:hypothetical protein [Muribaculaceae bacterium]